jgi:hypothetical protein
MPCYRWSALNPRQVNTCAKFFVQMEMMMHGFVVCPSKFDDRGNPFVAMMKGKLSIDVQVRSLRSLGYVFIEKSKFEPRENLYLALVLLFENKAPKLFFIPATTWCRSDGVFVERDYDAPGLKSKPEWGINLSKKNMPAIEKFMFDSVVKQLTGETDGGP